MSTQLQQQKPINNNNNHNNNNSETAAAMIAILGLPKGSAVSLDGHTIKLQRDDFVGIHGIPVVDNDQKKKNENDEEQDAVFHLVTVRAGALRNSSNTEKCGNAASSTTTTVTVGFTLSTVLSSSSSVVSQQNSTTSSLALARKFDPTTEEVSSTPLDDMTIANLCSQIQNQQIEPHRMISFANAFPRELVEHWKKQTNYISPTLLQKRGIPHGTKIVPGAYGETKEEVETTTTTPSSSTNPTTTTKKKLDNNSSKEEKIMDGTSVAYPAIPVIINILLDNNRTSSSARHSYARHAGTKQYLASLSPSERTALFMMDSNNNNPPQNFVMENLLRRYYDNRPELILGDVQLSYTLFLHLQCLLSLETWRDLVAMLCHVKVECMERHVFLYTEFMNILARQVTSIDEDFFEDIEMSGDNFLLPALEQLCSTALLVKDGPIQTSRSTLYQILQNRFRDSFGNNNDNHHHNNTAGSNSHDSSSMNDNAQQIISMDVDGEYDNHQNNDDKDEDDEAPVVVSTEEIEASIARSSQSQFLAATNNRSYPMEQYPLAVRKKYPVLFAAKLEHEDIMMTCARALDEQNDVSLVREAGDYLIEEVEPQTAEDDL